MTVGSAVPQFVFEGTLTFASVASSAAAWVPQTVTLPAGATFPSSGAGGGMLHLILPNLQAALGFCNVVPLTSTTFQISFSNPTAGGLTPTGTAAKLIMF